jgi:RimJ/RimL family protein N-acetyltransferase
VLSFNVRALRCYEKCGFVREGIGRESALVGGAWVDDVMMSILEREYRVIPPTWFATEA